MTSLEKENGFKDRANILYIYIFFYFLIKHSKDFFGKKRCSHIYHYSKILWAKSSHFNRNACDLEDCLRVNDFSMQWVQVGYMASPCCPAESCLTTKGLYTVYRYIFDSCKIDLLACIILQKFGRHTWTCTIIYAQ